MIDCVLIKVPGWDHFLCVCVCVCVCMYECVHVCLCVQYIFAFLRIYARFAPRRSHIVGRNKMFPFRT